MTTLLLSEQCRECARLVRGPGVVDGRWACEAFPKGIPIEIVKGRDHTRPVAGDGGKRFEPAR